MKNVTVENAALYKYIKELKVWEKTQASFR